MSVSELGDLSEREILLLLLDRMDNVLLKLSQHDTAITSLEQSRDSNAGFFKGINWILGLPGLVALLITGKQHL